MNGKIIFLLYQLDKNCYQEMRKHEIFEPSLLVERFLQIKIKLNKHHCKTTHNLKL